MYREKGQYKIIDAHCHIFPQPIAEKATQSIGHFYEIPMQRMGDPETLLDCGRRAGVEKFLVCSTATTPNQVRSINDYIASQCAAHKEFFGFGSVHPDMENIGDEIEYIKSKGLHGVKLHPDFQRFNIDAPQAYPIYEALGELPVLIHMGDARYDYSAPSRLVRVLRDFPKLHVMAAHLGGYSCWPDALAQLPHRSPYLRFDVSSSLAFLTPDYARKMIEAYGYENCFWGSDFPMWDHEGELERFFALGLPEEQNRAIFSENFEAYFA
jgi:predicted TIM-barrel fold metal-dependent hydrolase